MAKAKKAKKRKSNTKRKLVTPKAGAPRVGAALEKERATVKRLRAKLREAHAAKKNPRGAASRRGPPRAWWRSCLASVEASRTARVPAAVCYAAWWRRPPKERARIVRSMMRSARPRDRRAAIALAKAEERRHKRKPNPPRELVELVYEEQKPGDGEPIEYVHTFEGKRPKVTMRGGRLQIHGGSYQTRGGWIYG